MTIRTFFKRFSPALFLLALSCIEPFNPQVGQDTLNILVVDGFINATDQSATVRLSRTQPIAESGLADPETKATVTIDASTGFSYSLVENEPGEYKIDDLVTDKNAFYKLHINTISGGEYISDTIHIRATPPIDSLGFSITSNGNALSVHVNTHDPERMTRYYTWDYIETYEYKAPDSSEYKLINNEAIPRTIEESVYVCWRTEEDPTSISIGTSVRLAEDIINRHSIIQIPKGSPKLTIRYSVLVKQRALSPLEYNFLDQLRKSTETLGGIFGTEPISVLGNIRSISNKNEPVLGYFSGAEITEKRFFIEYEDMPDYFRTSRISHDCVFEQTCAIFPEPGVSNLFCVSLEDLPDDAIVVRVLDQNYYIFTSSECGDCRAKGGTTTRPPYW
jgi:hypothetical protein